jgi:glycosyltransferase involved in cell wall biosynthesis
MTETGQAEVESDKHDSEKRIVVGIDGHVLTGRYQGTRTTLSRLIAATMSKMGSRQIILYVDDIEAASRTLDTKSVKLVDLHGRGSIRRLLSFPFLFYRDKVKIGVFQYMMPLFGQNIVFIHDILPLTHPGFFPLKVRLRTRLFFTFSIRRAALIVAVSDFTKGEIKNFYKIKDKKVRVIKNGPSFLPEVYEGEPRQIEDKYILTVGRIEPRKNQLLLVEAFRKAELKDVRLIIVGSWDPEFPKGEILGSDVEVVSGVNDEDLIKLYRGASLFVYPSAAEGFGVPLLDATLFGLPIISSACTAMPEVAGALAEYFDPTLLDATDILAERIAAHFNEKPISRPSHAARQVQADRFSWDRAADDFLASIDSLASSKSA